ncbi:hypothetical protein AB4X15_01230 [Peribacillus simplex]|uniref:hypothetical protein n=1 Tax=Peribacillus TaxID=2675229 RepID=UPI00177E40E2|nr:hypothetical protein [Brevibacillus sp. JNUCC-41]QOS92264.1 hypothetical protein JNUCC41_11835 [Brevibacillus sp. JNUCC-41]
MKKTGRRCWQCYRMTIELNPPFGFTIEDDIESAIKWLICSLLPIRICQKK